MEPLRLSQQRVLRQLFSQRATLSRQSLHQLSQAPLRTQTCRFSTRPLNPFTQKSWYRPKKSFSSQPFRQKRWQSTTTASENEANLTLSGRLRKLSREYGWSALGVYLLLSALDFPFCFLAVRTLGTDRIGRWEHIVLSYIKSVVPEAVYEVKWPWGQREVEKRVEGGEHVDGKIDPVDMSAKMEVENGKRILEERGADYKHEPREGEQFLDHGVHDAEKANSGDNASIWTQLALAYAIHKSFIFLRVPLTAAVTPKVVKTLRGWGWNIGKRPQTGRLAKKQRGANADGTGVNTKGTGVKPE